MATYVVAIRREARLEVMTAEEWVRQVPSVHVKGASNPSRVVIEAPPQVGQLLAEAQRRLAEGKGSRAELEAAVQQARLSLDRLVPRPAKHARPSRSGKTSPPLQEGQRKAMRAALLAGVAPNQVAKHFGLPLAAVRKVLEEPG